MGLGEMFSGLWLGGGRVTDRVVPEGGSCDGRIHCLTPPPTPVLSPSPSTPPRTTSLRHLDSPLSTIVTGVLDSFASLEI